MSSVNVFAKQFTIPRLGDKKTGTKQLKKTQDALGKSAKTGKSASSGKNPPPTFGTQAKRAQQAIGQKAQQAIGQNKPAGYRRYEGDALWLPATERPEWLDGSLPGDRGFDPLGFGKKQEYLQVDIDQQDITAASNKKGEVIGQFQDNPLEVTQQSLQPYGEVFSLPRFRECELIHGRWAMLATLGVLVAEGTTGVSWVDAGKVELEQPRYLGFELPFTIGQVSWIEAILVGGAEIYRNSELDFEKRIYPGGPFDPLGLAKPDRARRLQEAEIKHARLAMIAFLGFSIQAFTTGEGALGSLAKFTGSK